MSDVTTLSMVAGLAAAVWPVCKAISRLKGRCQMGADIRVWGRFQLGKVPPEHLPVRNGIRVANPPPVLDN